MARAQSRGHAQTLFDSRHVAFNMVANLETTGLQVLDPVLAATTVGVPVHVDYISGMDAAGHKQGGNECELGF